MSYSPTNWKSGDTITADRLNKMEQGIANSSGGGSSDMFLVQFYYDPDLASFVSNKTFTEVSNAVENGNVPVVGFYLANGNTGDLSVRTDAIFSDDGLQYVTFSFWYDDIYDGQNVFALDVLKMDADGVTETFTTYTLTPNA